MQNKKHLYLICLVSCYAIFCSAQNIGVKLPLGALPNTTLDVNGASSFREGTALVLSNGTNNNVSLTTEYSFYRITGPTGTFSVTGFTNGQDGRLLTLVNATSQTMTISGSTGSASANQILTGSSDFSVPANGSVTFQYNTTLFKWVLLSTTGASTTTSDWALIGNSGTNPAVNFIGTTDAQDLVIKTNNTEGMRMLSSNRYVGLGTTSPTYPLHVSATGADVWNGGAAFFNATSVVYDKNQTAVHSQVTANPSSASTRHFMGVFGNGISSGSNLSAARISGLYGQANHASSSTLSGAIGVSAEIYNTGAGTITNAYGVYIFPSVNNGTITNNYGLYINALTNGTNNYSIYSAGGQSYHAGNFGIGITSPNSTLEVNGSVAKAILTTSAASLTLDATHHTVIINTGATTSITLPTASSCNRRMYIIVNRTTGSRTISTYQTIASGTSTSIPANSAITLQSDGVNWYRIL